VNLVVPLLFGWRYAAREASVRARFFADESCVYFWAVVVVGSGLGAPRMGHAAAYQDWGISRPTRGTTLLLFDFPQCAGEPMFAFIHLEPILKNQFCVFGGSAQFGMPA